MTTAFSSSDILDLGGVTTAQGPMQVVVTVNGPGEVACWLHPLALELKRRNPSIRICAAVVPCTFSTGSELGVLKTLPFIDASCSIEETKALIMGGRLPEGFERDVPGIIIHLGGDSLFTWLMSMRLRQPCIAYAERPLALQSRFADVFYSGFEPIRGRHARGAKIVGEMMVDAALMHCPSREPSRQGPVTVGLYPGSRDYLAMYFLPFYAAVAERIAQTRPDVEFMLAKSDFLPLSFLKNIPDVNDGRPLDAVELRYEDDGAGGVLVTPKGVRIAVRAGGEVTARARVALCLPGSNTAELSAVGLPMVITLPTWWAERAPLPGLPGHIGRVPLIGKYIKRFLSHQFLRRMRFLSHPNRRTGRMVVPEVVGRITSGQIAEEVLKVVDADTRPLEVELRAIMGEPGATARFVDGVEAFLKSSAGKYETA